MLSNKKYLAEKILDPLVKPLAKVNPNTLTLLGIIPSILFFVSIINHQYLLAIIAFAGNIFDLIDGAAARKFNKVTKFGGVLDSTFDRISDFLIISAFGFAGIVGWEIVATLLLFSFLISYIRSRGELANPSISLSIGVIERTERLFSIAITLILFMLFPSFKMENFNVVEIGFIILLILSFYTIIQRLIYLYKKL